MRGHLVMNVGKVSRFQAFVFPANSSDNGVGVLILRLINGLGIPDNDGLVLMKGFEEF